jgi:tRNA A58 N-methylase Trm61
MCHICPSWLSFILYNPIRKAFTNREKILSESGIGDDSVVLEVGAGNGFLTEAVAAHAKKVYAVELQEGMATKLRKRIDHFGDKVVVVHGDIASCDMGDEVVDACLLYYSFHEVRDKLASAKNISKSIKPGGVLSIYEPTIEVRAVDMQETTEMFERFGLKKEKEREGPFTRFVRLRKHGGR